MNAVPRSLRAHLLRLLLAPVALVLAAGAIAAYYLSLDPAADAHDHSLINAAWVIGERIRIQDGRPTIEIPGDAEAVLRTDKYDRIFYVVLGPDGEVIGGDAGIPGPPPGSPTAGSVLTYNGDYRGLRVRVASLALVCGERLCTIKVAETMVKRERLAREILAGSVLPQALLAVLTLAIVWFGVSRGLAPLARLSDELAARSPRDLRPVDASNAPQEAQPVVGALNRLLGEVAEANRNQQRFLANAAHQLRTPLAGLRAHTELALAQPVPEGCRVELEEVHRATLRTARLANQLLSLARAEPGSHAGDPVPIDLRVLAEERADEWVQRAIAREIDLGFELAPAPSLGDAFLLREAMVNLVANAIEYTPAGGHVTVRTGGGAGDAWFEVEDEGPGIPAAERALVLERFYRVAGTPGTGSGLGLAIVREICAAQDARLEIGEGAGGRGCRVRLTLDPRPARG